MTHTGVRSKSAGFTLIEVLVALAVLSIGLLGVAALQSKGQLYTRDAYTLTQATVQANQIIDKIRFNQVFARADVITNGTAVGKGYVVSSKPGGTVDCVANACSASDLRTYDLNEWYNELARVLPGGQGTIGATIPTAGVVQYQITVIWTVPEGLRDDPDDPATAARQKRWVVQL